MVWAITKKLDIYLKGLPKFTIVTDHKPLIPILNSFTLDMIDGPRLQRLKYKISSYNFEAIWKKGAENYIPDALSRAPCSDPTPEDSCTDEQEVVASVRLIVNSVMENTERQNLCDPFLKKIKEAAAADPEYAALLEVVKDGFPSQPEHLKNAVRNFWQVRDSLIVSDNLVLKGNQIVVPRNMRKDVLSQLHASHQGIERTKRRARQTVFWPGINSDILSTVRACEPCQIHQSSQQKEPFRSDAAATRPFEDTSADLFSHGGRHYMVYVDRYSGWPIVYSWKSDPTAQQVTNKLAPDFATYGAPLRLRTDGGPQFTSSMFKNFLDDWNVDTGFSSPHYPQSNGHAEAAVKAMKGLVKKTDCKGDLAHPAFVAGLAEWRNTPKEHGCSPAQLLFGHSIRTKMPATTEALQDPGPDCSEKRNRIFNRKKSYYNRDASALKPFSPGDRVRLQDHTTGQWDRTGSIISAGSNRNYLIDVDDGGPLKRNRRFLRPEYLMPTSTRGEGKKKRVTFNLPPEPELESKPRRSMRAHRSGC